MAVDPDAVFDQTFWIAVMRGKPFVEDGAPALAIEDIQHNAEARLTAPAEFFLAEESDCAQAALHVGALGIECVVEVKDGEGMGGHMPFYGKNRQRGTSDGFRGACRPSMMEG